MFNKSLFIAGHQVGDRRFYPTHKELIQNQFDPYISLKMEQEKQLKHIISFAYQNVPYYHKLFNNLNLKPEDIKRIEDLEKLPILSKEVIRDHWEDFKPINLGKLSYYTRATSGSLGNPFKYRLSKFDRFLSAAILYRGWGYGGYELGDEMVFLAGSSLGMGLQTLKSKAITKGHQFVRNIKMLSSYDLGPEDIIRYTNIINSYKPKFLMCYASAIYFFAKFVDENNLSVYSPLAIFTTSEKLYPIMRKKIEDVFDCEVYDTYGLNDGGVTAFECEEHSGLHIDTERSIMEIVDESGRQLEDGVGNILATSLYNYSMPFIRYDSKDLGHLVDDVCSCGRKHKLLKEVIGRDRDIFETPEGKRIHGGFFTHLFWDINGVKEFQIVQKKLDLIVIKIVSDCDFDENQLYYIKKMIYNKSEAINVEFKFVDMIERTKAGKYKFVVSELGNI